MTTNIESTAGTHKGTLMGCLNWHKLTNGHGATIKAAYDENGFFWGRIDAGDASLTAKQLAAKLIEDWAKATGEGISEHAGCDSEWLAEQGNALLELAREAEAIGQ